jgi:hypothetical protein
MTTDAQQSQSQDAELIALLDRQAQVLEMLAMGAPLEPALPRGLHARRPLLGAPLPA